MNKNYILAFLGGASVGALASYFITKKCIESKYEVEWYEKPEPKSEKSQGEESEEKDDKEYIVEEKPPITDYASVLHRNNYIPPNAPLRPEAGTKKKRKRAMEFIDEDQFGDREDYDLITLTYYMNDVLTDDMDEPIGDRYAIIPRGFEGKFNDNDAVYVVNRREKAYYEILRVDEDYTADTRPQRIEVD